MLKIKGYEVEVDYAEELEQYLEQFHRVQIRGNKVQACSPFRNEQHPSFAVNLDNGTWVDSGANEEGNRKGNFISLLSFLREETYEETADYLFEKYTHILDDAEGLELKLELKLDEPEVAVLGQEKYSDVVGKVSEYLTGRGIGADIQLYFETGIGTKGDCIALPWHDKFGRIINIKYRSIKTKDFWFSKGGQPIKQHVYGLFAVIEGKHPEVWAVESEIDALYLWSYGIPAVAFGGASMNDVQKGLLLSAGIETLVIATDNDTVGQRFGEVLKNEFAGYMNIKKVVIPEGFKDVNDLNYYHLRRAKENLQYIPLFNLVLV